jgi:uncharacterized protein (TIGR02996 family)
MPDEIAFLHTILERPRDDAPRLVYADWLEERGDTARAEFIRVQIELANLPPADPRRAALQQRERELLAQHERAWVMALGDWVREWHFSRGLLEYVRVTAADFLRHGSKLFEQAAVQYARLNDATNHIPAIAASPALRWLRRLDLSYNSLTAERLAPLLESAAVANLEALDLGMNQHFSDVGATALARSPHLRSLRSLRLHRTGLHGSGVVGLSTGGWPQLAELDLDNNPLGPRGGAEVTVTRFAAGLRRLSLRSTNITDATAEALATSSRLTQLTVLNLHSNRITEAGAVALAQSPGLAALEELDLGNNRIGSEGARALVESRYLADLRRLNLSRNRLTLDDTLALKRRFGNRVVLVDPTVELPGDDSDSSTITMTS